jgi:hypothetical protein
VVVSEIDLSALAAEAFGHSYLLLGESGKGRDDKPISTTNKASFVRMFGQQSPNYPSVYSAMEYLSFGNQLNYKRVTSTKFIKFLVNDEAHAHIDARQLGDRRSTLPNTPMFFIADDTFKISTSWREGQPFPFHTYLRESPRVLMIFDRNGDFPMIKAYLKDIYYYNDPNDVVQAYKGIPYNGYEYFGFEIAWDAFGQDYSALSTANAIDWTSCDIYIGHAEPAFNTSTRFLKDDTVPAGITLSFLDGLEKNKWLDGVGPTTLIDGDVHYVTYYAEGSSTLDLYAPTQTDIFSVEPHTGGIVGGPGQYCYYRWSMSNTSFETNLSRPILVSLPNGDNKVVFNFPALRNGYTRYNLYRTETIDASSNPLAIYDPVTEVYKTHTSFLALTSQSFIDDITTGNLTDVPLNNVVNQISVEIDGTVEVPGNETYGHFVSLDSSGDVIGEYFKDVFYIHQNASPIKVVSWAKGNSDQVSLGLTLRKVIKVYATDVSANSINTGVLTKGDGVRTPASVTGQILTSDWVPEVSTDSSKYCLWRYTGDQAAYSYAPFTALDADPQGNAFQMYLDTSVANFVEYPTIGHFRANYTFVTTDYSESAVNPTYQDVNVTEVVAAVPTAAVTVVADGDLDEGDYVAQISWVGADGSETSASPVDAGASVSIAALPDDKREFTVTIPTVPAYATGWFLYVHFHESIGPSDAYYKIGSGSKSAPFTTATLTHSVTTVATDLTPYLVPAENLPANRSYRLKVNIPEAPAGLRSLLGSYIYLYDVTGLDNYQMFNPDWHMVGEVVAASAAPVVLTGPQTVDGVACVAGDRVLVKDQVDAKTNGIYVVAVGAWTRASDSDTGGKVQAAYFFVQNGTVNAGTYFFNSNIGLVTLTSTNITYSLVKTLPSTYNGPRTVFATSKTSATEFTLSYAISQFPIVLAQPSSSTAKAVDYINLFATLFNKDFYLYNENDFDRYATISKGRGTWANGMPVFTAYNSLTEEYEVLVYDPVNGTLLEKWTNSKLTDLLGTVTEYSNFIKFNDLSDWTYSTNIVPFGIPLTGRTSSIPYYEADLNYGYDGTFAVDEGDFIANLDPGVAAAKYNLDSSYVDLVNTAAMIYEFDGVFDYEIISIPGWSSHPSLATSMYTACEHRRFSAAITDMPMGLNPQQAVDYRTSAGNNSLSNLNSSYGALYWNWGKVYDAVNDVYVWLPPSTFAIRSLAVTDSSSVPWAAAAGLRRGLVPEVLELEFNPTLGDRDDLYRVQINPIARIGTTIAVWGDATTQKLRSMLSAFHVRRILVSAEKSVYLTSLYSLFEPNDQIERDRLINTIMPIFDSIKQQRGLLAFGVFDATTDQDASYNTARFRIELQPVPAMEIILHEFVIKNPMQSISAPGQGI